MNRAKRHKQPAEDLDAAVDDILNNPITKSNLSFLVRPKLLDQPLDLVAPKTSIDPKPMDPKTVDLPSLHVTPVDHTATDLKPVDPLPTDQDNRHANIEDVPALRFYKRPKAKPARTVQDGHSAGEEKIYDLLWKYSKPFNDEARIISIGYSAVAELSRLAVTNCRANIFSLMEKLAVTEYRDYEKGGTKTYLVFSFSAILRRRRDAGLTHVIRTRGVMFVNPETGESLTRQMGEFRRLGRSILSERPIGERSIPSGSISERSTDIRSAAERFDAKRSVGERDERSIGERSTRSYRDKSFSESTTTLRSIVQAQLPTFDDDAVDEVWASCRKRVTDVTPEEVGRLFAEKLPAIRNQKVHSPNPFLVHAVVKSCTAAAIAALRQGREVPEIPAIRFQADELDAMLNDPKTPEVMRAFIRARIAGGEA